MKSLRELYRVGLGPSSSHTMGPAFAAQIFKPLAAGAHSVKVTLYGSLAATGRGHLTDVAVSRPLVPLPVDIVWRPDQNMPLHPNALAFEALDGDESVMIRRVFYSVGGGALLDEDGHSDGGGDIYPQQSMQEMLDECERDGVPLWQLVDRGEGPPAWTFLAGIWQAMQRTIARGLATEGRLPGPLGVPRKAASYHGKARGLAGHFGQTARLFAYALAVAEENAGGGEVVTAPTCGSCGILPAVLYFLQQQSQLPDSEVVRALATAGLIGNLVKRNASISGAEVGCQGEVGTACAMAAGAAAQLFGGSLRQIEYAAEMGLEHHLGLTCDPVGGYVQIPCIERNAIAAVRAVDCAAYALLSDGQHLVSFDEVVRTMRDTGRDMHADYRETAAGGLAKLRFMAKRQAGDSR